MSTKKVLLLVTFLTQSLLSFGQFPTYNCTSDTTVQSPSCDSAVVTYTIPYGNQSLSDSVTYNYTGSIQDFIVPSNITSIQIKAWGASGGNSNWSTFRSGGKGAYIEGTVSVTPGDTLKILVGQEGETASVGGGGGGTFIVDSNGMRPLIVAGGGGGASSDNAGLDASTGNSGTSGTHSVASGGTNGNGGSSCQTGANSGGAGGGFYTDGQDGGLSSQTNRGRGGKSFLNGGTGGAPGRGDGLCSGDPYGGFGGGGSATCHTVGGGGGGGYSGGAGGQHINTCATASREGGGGGGSYNSGSNQTNTAGANTGHGKVTIIYSAPQLSASLHSGLGSGGKFPVGSNEEVWVMTDTSGATDTCRFKIFVSGAVNGDTLTTNACGSYESPSGNHTWTSSGTYTDTLSTVGGCDSIITIQLTINPTSLDTITTTVCDTFTTASGRKITSSGTYMDTVANQYGCDSVLYYDLTITNKLFVDSSASSSGNGASFGQAFKTLKEAINAANGTNNDVVIWATSGTYYTNEDGSSGAESTFLITNINAKLYGGFDGTESDPSDRDPSNPPSILCGDIGTPGDNSDNAHHVVSIIDSRPVTGGEQVMDTASFVIDGFVIRDGNASGGSKTLLDGKGIWKNSGGGMYIYSEGSGREISPSIRNCTFENNSADFGGAVYIEVPNGSCNAVFESNVFKNNSSTYGAFFINGRAGDITPTINNCVFDNNTSATSGAALYSYGYGGVASPTVINTVFYNNTANAQGGAVYNHGGGGESETSLMNCTFVGNTAGSNGGAIYNYGDNGDCEPTITNSVFAGNNVGGDDSTNNAEIFNYEADPSVSYCLMQLDSTSYDELNRNDIGSGTGNLFGADPAFYNASNGAGSDGIWGTVDDGLHPTGSSPLVNSGTNSGAPSEDLTGESRSGGVEIGAYQQYHGR